LAGSGWTTVQLSVMPFVAVAAAVVIWLRWSASRVAPNYAGE